MQQEKRLHEKVLSEMTGGTVCPSSSPLPCRARLIFPSPGRRLPLLRGKDDATHPKRPGCHYYLSGSYHKYGNIIVRDSRCRGIAWGFLGLGGPIPGPLAPRRGPPAPPARPPPPAPAPPPPR